MRRVTLGGDRLGSGKKQKVELHGYERSTHDLGYLWRSTISAGTLVPFIHEIGLPGDTFDINLGCDIKTHPTVGPLFGSYKVQLDVFTADIRLYQGQLHNNKLNIGMHMQTIMLPMMHLYSAIVPDPLTHPDYDNAQINPSCIHAYLGIRGLATFEPLEPEITRFRSFHAIYLLAYWDIYKNYYANKQENIGAVIHTPLPNISIPVSIEWGGILIPEYPTTGNVVLDSSQEFIIDNGGSPVNPNYVIFNTSLGLKTLKELTGDTLVESGPSEQTGFYQWWTYGTIEITYWRLANFDEIVPQPPQVATFDLENLDVMREAIMAATQQGTPFDVTTYAMDEDLAPYNWVMGINESEQFNKLLQTQEGLAIKTYQSDLFNNWLRTEYIDGPGGINEITAVDTTAGDFQLDTLNLAKKIYNMLNRIAVSGGTYKDWVIATYDHEPYGMAETPIYHGGLSKELIFQEVVSNAAATGGEGGGQPLGTLAGKGRMAEKHKGGQVSIKINEHCVVIGLISITPRIDYSQGNKWDVNLLTMDDFHKPPLDEIGFQDLIEEQMAWWSTKKTGGLFVQKSAGKQPAWINYMTNVNETRGNFAIKDNEMFMTLNRRYEYDKGTTAADILDLTTYIDPTKFNYIFAETAIDAQNFWAQVAIDMTVRRKMSAKIMPQV